MKKIYIRASLMLPVGVYKDGAIVDKGTEAIIHGPSRVLWNPKADHPKVWIEVEDDVTIEITKE